MIDLSSWRVRTRLTVGFGAVCALLVLSVVMGLIAMGRMQAGMVSIAHDHWPKIATAANLTTQTDTIAIALRNMMLNPDAADRERQQQVIAKARKDTEDNLQTLDRLLTTAPDREMLRKVQELRSRYFADLEELRPLILADQNNEAREYLAARLRPVLGEYKTAIGALVESEKNAINDDAKDAAVIYAGTRNLLLGLYQKSSGFYPHLDRRSNQNLLHTGSPLRTTRTCNSTGSVPGLGTPAGGYLDHNSPDLCLSDLATQALPALAAHSGCWSERFCFPGLPLPQRLVHRKRNGVGPCPEDPEQPSRHHQ